MTTSPPSRIRLGARIARGGMAEVFAARLVGPAGFEKDVAVKRVLPRHASDPVFLQRFLTEARLAALLSHPHIVQIFELGADGEDHYIVMEAVRGVTLRDLMRRLDEVGERLPRGVALLIARALCAGLAHAHERTGADGRPLHIIHRDVSPHNVLLGHDGAIKLIDFGIAQAVDSGRLTQVGRPIGKPWYMAPEQLSSSSTLDGRVDVYAVGVILHELLTGQRPWDSEAAGGEADLVARVRAGRRRPVIELAPDLEPPIAALVERSLAVRREERPASARAMAAELGAVIEATGHRADAHTLEALLHRLMPDELARPWPVDDVRTDDAEHTRTAGVAVREITLSADIGLTDDVTAPVTAPSVVAPARRGAVAGVAAGVVAFIALAAVAVTLLVVDTPAPAVSVVADGGGPSSGVGVDAGAPGGVRDTHRAAVADVVDGGADVGVDVGVGVDVDVDGGVDIGAAGAGDDAGQSRRERRLERVARREARAAGRRGQLIVETRPWSDVTLDGRPIGQTPLQRDLRVGRHQLVLEHPPLGLRRELTIDVTAETPAVVRIDLRAP